MPAPYPSPFRQPFVQQPQNAGESSTARQYSDTLMSVPLNWKTPVFSDRTRPTPVYNGDEEEWDEQLTQLPALPALTWKAPTLAQSIHDDDGDKGSSITKPSNLSGDPKGQIEPSPSQLPMPPASSCSTFYEDDGGYDLDSVLLDEEEFYIPEYNRHRTLTGLLPLDERFAAECHEVVDDEAGNEMPGLACGAALEMIGTPSSGKTSLLIQIAVLERLSGLQRAHQIAFERNNQQVDVKGEPDWTALATGAQQVLLIDTEGSIGIDRIMHVAQHHVEGSLQGGSSSSKTNLLRAVLAGLLYYRCTTDYELLALLLTLMPPFRRPSQTQTMPLSRPVNEEEPKLTFPSKLPPRTSLILIDTMSYVLRAPLLDEARQLRTQRNRVLDELRLFTARCRRRGIKIVVANQMGVTIVGKEGTTTSLSDKDGEGRLVPLLRSHGNSILGSDVWRVLLFRAGNQSVDACSRFAHIISPPLSVARQEKSTTSTREKTQWLPLETWQGGVRAVPFTV